MLLSIVSADATPGPNELEAMQDTRARLLDTGNPRRTMADDFQESCYAHSTYTSLAPIFQWHAVAYLQDLNLERTVRHSWASESEDCEYKKYHSDHRCLSELRNCRRINGPCKNSKNNIYIDQSPRIFPLLACDDNFRETERCSYKLCTCQNLASDVDRHFSLKSVLSDVHSNKVITGVELTKANYTIHIQIQQGQLLKGGAINESTVQWKAIDHFSPLDYDVEEGEDYHTIAFDSDTVCMNDIDAEQPNEMNYVLTGLRFKVVERSDFKDLYLEIQKTPYDVDSGVLRVSESEWISKTKPDELSENLILKEKDLLDGTDQSKRESKVCVPFVHDEFKYDKKKRLISEIIPKIDIQQVTTFPPVALAGAGLFYNHEEQDKIKGGRISMKVFTSSYLVRGLP
ncbi:hypothetical protein QAD02_016964 [Eretmocerus hayati]|uniref:Uncharacterized protein n=1 Tax=Eretmocerus hayati TaxID=131215 RepID=A0ACC2PFF0_9HYME|nr:hypothetical protein QAD02_016964 [Eretmocerus hayati]